jgi:hypothetical protein
MRGQRRIAGGLDWYHGSFPIKGARAHHGLSNARAQRLLQAVSYSYTDNGHLAMQFNARIFTRETLCGENNNRIFAW